MHGWCMIHMTYDIILNSMVASVCTYCGIFVMSGGFISCGIDANKGDISKPMYLVQAHTLYIIVYMYSVGYWQVACLHTPLLLYIVFMVSANRSKAKLYNAVAANNSFSMHTEVQCSTTTPNPLIKKSSSLHSSQPHLCVHVMNYWF